MAAPHGENNSNMKECGS